MPFAVDRTRKLGRGLKSLLGEPEDEGDVAVATAESDAETAAPVRAGPASVPSGGFSVTGNGHSNGHGHGHAHTNGNGHPGGHVPTPAQVAAPVARTAPLPPDAAPAPAGDRLLQLPVNVLRPNPFQPRSDFDEAGLDELADTIRTSGVLSPLLVRRAPDGGYELIAGERRLRAAKRAGLASVPVLLRQAGDAEALEHALIENLQRRDLNPIEKARAIGEFLSKRNLPGAEAEKRLGMSRSELSNHLRLLKLAPAVQEAVRAGTVGYGHARALLGIEDPARQLEVAERVRTEGLSVRQVEAFVRGESMTLPVTDAAPVAAADDTATAPADGAVVDATPAADTARAGKTAPAARSAKAGAAKPRDAQIRELEDEMTAAVGLRVTIKPARKGSHAGVVSIAYGSLDDFDRVRGLLTGVQPGA